MPYREADASLKQISGDAQNDKQTQSQWQCKAETADRPIIPRMTIEYIWHETSFTHVATPINCVYSYHSLHIFVASLAPAWFLVKALRMLRQTFRAPSLLTKLTRTTTTSPLRAFSTSLASNQKLRIGYIPGRHHGKRESLTIPSVVFHLSSSTSPRNLGYGTLHGG